MPTLTDLFLYDIAGIVLGVIGTVLGVIAAFGKK